MKRVLTGLLMLLGLMGLLGPAATAWGSELDAVRALVEQRQFSPAMSRLDRFLASHPANPQARFLKGLILTEQNQQVEAIQIFQALTHDYPDLPEPYNNLAVLYAEQGMYDRAREALLLALKTHPSYATAQENLGDIYAKMASQAYRSALRINSDNSMAQAKLALVRNLFAPVGVSEDQALSEEAMERARTEAMERLRSEAMETLRAEALQRVRAEALQQVRAEMLEQVRAEMLEQVRAEVMAQVRADELVKLRAEATELLRAEERERAESDARERSRAQILQQAREEAAERLRLAAASPEPGRPTPGGPPEVRAQNSAASPPALAPRTAPEPPRLDEAGVRERLREEAEDAVRQWARAWSDQDPQRYLSFYATNFRLPSGFTGRQAWERRRRALLRRPAMIRVALDQLSVVLDSAESARVTFVQSYRSNTYQDVVNKTLELRREGGHWRILRETTNG